MADPLPAYNPDAPFQYQDADFDCSQESAQWCLRAWGRSPDDAWMTQSLIDNGIMSAELGLVDASGAGMAGWFNQEYGEFGYVASNEPSVTFDDVASEAATGQHPLMIGGRAWYHWVGCAGYDAGSDLLVIRNSAPGYMGVDQTLGRGQWANLGAFSMVRLTHPAAEGLVPEPEPDPPPDLSAWEGAVGSGLLEMMAADGTEPVSVSTWLPLGGAVADIEEAMGANGVVYRWALSINAGFRYSPD
jgi:hypothetical protein